MCRTRTSHVAEMKNILDSTVNIILKVFCSVGDSTSYIK